MFCKSKSRRLPAALRYELSHRDARMLRDIGFNPEDFRDAFEGRRSSLLFQPFRHPNGD